jgi:hypothetical protein
VIHPGPADAAWGFWTASAHLPSAAGAGVRRWQGDHQSGERIPSVDIPNCDWTTELFNPLISVAGVCVWTGGGPPTFTGAVTIP